MKVTLLGTGTPTTRNRFQSAVLVEIADRLLLFDAGRGTVYQMGQLGIEINRVNPVFITHHHFDHINDLFDVIISTAMRGRRHALKIFGPLGTQKIVQALLEQVYAQDIRFRIEEGNDIRRLGGENFEQPEAIAKVDTHDVEPGIIDENEHWRISTDYVLHGDFAHVPDFDWRCLGYRIEAEGKVVTISGDTVPCDGIVNLAQNADLLVQCCHLPQSLVTDIATTYLTTAILPSSGQVGQIAAQAKVKRMALTHLGTTIQPVNFSEILDDVRRDFDGEIILGVDLLEIEV